MLLNKTVTRKILETLVHETFSQFGIINCSSLLDSLKLLGFYYATVAGISINLEDLKTPNLKRECIENANKEITEVSNKWQQGFVSETERFQTIIDSWNIATESLKNKIVDYYKNLDPTNNLYIMAFSGARGNMSQVRQLVGMRGLMSDQEGKIIDLPIQRNFREGLSSIDYIISSYGARKGIVDTALKTADSGYLTRRLIYIAQDLIIREIDCKIEDGLLFEFRKNSNTKNLIGRTLIKAISVKTMKPLNVDNKILTYNFFNELKENTPLILNVRSSLICKSNGSICQKCYGWDLAQQKYISLGEAVGIIAAQSIGEPGTQLTMRTFHTGGIFTGENIKQILSPFSGKLILPKNLKTISYRTNHGIIVLKLQEETNLTLIDWEGKKSDIFLDIGSFLYKNKSSFIKKDELIAEYSTQTLITGSRKLKPIYTSLAGEIRFENLLIRKMLRDKRTIKVNQDDGILWIASGKIFPLPKESEYLFPEKLSLKKPFAKLKIISPISGLVLINNLNLKIESKDKTILNLDISTLVKKIKNCKVKISLIIKNYQYIDKHTVLGFIEIFPNFEGLIYSVRKKESKNFQTLFLITEADIWKINSDQVNNFDFFQNKKAVVRCGNLLNKNSQFSRSGFFLKRNGFQMIFQNAIPIFLTRGTILNYKQGDFVLENKVFATLVNYTQQTEDIVQGLPKIEELIEARRPNIKTKAILAIRPGILLLNSFMPDSKSDFFKRTFKNNFINCIYDLNKDEKIVQNRSKIKQDKQIINIAHSLFLKENFVIYKNLIFNALPIPSIFKIYKKIDQKGKIKKDEFIFRNNQNEQLMVDGKIPLSTWKSEKLNLLKDETIYKVIKGELNEWITFNSNSVENIFKNPKGDYILQTNQNTLIFLEYLNPITNYELPLTSKVLLDSGNFIDIGEPITEGIIDVHDLLHILFIYHAMFDGILVGTIRSLNKFQILLVNSIQSIYQSQGVNISSKHIEIIVKQMTAKVVIKESGDTPLLPGELIRISLITEIYLALKDLNSKIKYKTPKYEPLLLSSTNASLSKDGFLSAAGFQETKRVLTKAAIEGTSDWLRGLKECIIIGRLIPAGSAFLNYKNYLDNIYLFKN
jgi:hypothetical protein